MVNNIKKIIAIDMDDVLNPLVPVWIESYCKKYNDTLLPSDITSWDITQFVKPECGDKIYDLLFEPNFFSNMTPKEDSQEVTKWLSQYYDIYIVTNTHYKTYQQKIEWVMKHYPHLKVEDGKFISLKNKYLFKADYLIDDGVQNIEPFPNTGLLFTANHNLNYNTDDKKVVRVNNWIDVKAFFEIEQMINGGI